MLNILQVTKMCLKQLHGEHCSILKTLVNHSLLYINNHGTQMRFPALSLFGFVLITFFKREEGSFFLPLISLICSHQHVYIFNKDFDNSKSVMDVTLAWIETHPNAHLTGLHIYVIRVHRSIYNGSKLLQHQQINCSRSILKMRHWVLIWDHIGIQPGLTN